HHVLELCRRLCNDWAPLSLRRAHVRPTACRCCALGVDTPNRVSATAHALSILPRPYRTGKGQTSARPAAPGASVGPIGLGRQSARNTSASPCTVTTSRLLRAW